jgi:signal transduction histidine kinase
VDEKQVHYLNRIDENVERMAAIIGFVMDFSRQSEHRREPVPVHHAIERSFILLNEKFRLLSIQVERDLCPREPRVRGDSLRLEQVFLNLLNNARDAIVAARGPAGGMIRVATVERDFDLEISISDNGTGMSDEVREKIFQPFFTTKEVGKGTGLGLSISLGIVEEHGGTLSCSSQPGQGATFTIVLPRLR